MSSTTSRGNYYKKKSKEHYEKLGYTVQLTEFTCGRQIPGGRIIYKKVDIFGSDGISMNGEEVIFWNSKHFTSTDSRRVQISQAKKEFRAYPFPKTVKLHIVMWESRKKPVIIECNE